MTLDEHENELGAEARIQNLPPSVALTTVLRHNHIRLIVVKSALFVVIVQNSLVMLVFWLATLQAQHFFKGIPFATLLSVLMALNAVSILFFALAWRHAEKRIRHNVP